MSVRLVIVAVAIAVGIIASAVVLYFNPAISSTLGQPEDKQQEPMIDKEVRSGTNGYRQVDVNVNGFLLIADIATTDEQKTKGLSVKDSLAENEGMLFVFDDEAQHPFWMKNMKFPIDIIWIDSDKRVVHIEHNLQPCSSELLCPIYKPVGDSLYVLETVAGFTERHGIVKAAPVDFELNT